MDCVYVYVFLFLLTIKCESRVQRVRRIVGGIPAEVPPPDDPVIYVKHNGKFARIEGTRNPNEYHYQFRGIRYAEAPVGKQRFQRPKEYIAEGNIDARKFPDPCLQPQPGTNNVIGSEDCLFLNVFTPVLPQGTEGLPVVLWIHGGGYRYGSASQYNVQNLVNKKLVLVTIQYRLGSLGFLSTGDLDLPGNAGLFDMALAVQWTRNYIGFFGGNPYQIVVMGQGAGASSGLLLCLSNIAKGLTKGVVAMSGTPVSNWAIDNEPKKIAVQIAERHGCPTNNVLIMISCLRALPADDIVRTDSVIEDKLLKERGYISGLAGKLTPYPANEGRYDSRSIPGFIQQLPAETIDKGDAQNIPLLIGVTKDETEKAINGQFRNEIIKKLTLIPNYINEVFVKSLQNIITGNKIPISTQNQQHISLGDSIQLSSYMSSGKSNVTHSISKIAEATNDVLFNLPAYLTAQKWSKYSNSTYLYRFEHLGSSYKGYNFLRGLPIIGNISLGNSTENFIGHGDELPFLFTPQNLDGSKLNININETEQDKEVRNIFTDIIYSFVKFGQIIIHNKTLPKFTKDDSNYIGISAKPKLHKNFRFCQIGLWAQIVERLETTTCKILSTVDQGIQDASSVFTSTADKISHLNPIQSNMKKPSIGIFG